jgi:hypothetical protein
VGSKCRDRRKKIGENGRIPGGSYLKSKKGGNKSVKRRTKEAQEFKRRTKENEKSRMEEE